jgi:hypothetical protein
MHESRLVMSVTHVNNLHCYDVQRPPRGYQYRDIQHFQLHDDLTFSACLPIPLVLRTRLRISESARGHAAGWISLQPLSVSYAVCALFLPPRRERRRQRKSELTIPERASGRGRQPAGQVEGEQKEGRGRRKGTKRRGARERNLSITIARNQSSTV